MAINVRTKGQNGEREAQDMLNNVYLQVLCDNSLPIPDKRDYPFQRNQNQSAVGGSDLSNPFQLEIEVKRQEVLCIDKWWEQCISSAKRTGGEPVLLFKQNRKKWRVIILTHAHAGNEDWRLVRSEIPLTDFLQWIYDWISHKV